MKREKQILRKMAGLLAMTVVALVLIQCRPAPPDMVGTWNISLLEVFDDGDQELESVENFGSMEFNEDGSGVFIDGRAIAWSQSGDNLSIVLEGEETVYTVTAIDDKVYEIESTANNMTTVMTITRQ